jgi:hypothetical protein
MKSKFALVLTICLILFSGSLMTSCTEEEVAPSNSAGTDDWEKHNV